jgi:dTMP kinase
MPRKHGLFIVIEGLDGAGTTTQTRKLHKHLIGNGLDAVLAHEPTDEPVGKLIRDVLSGRLSSPTSGEKIRFAEGALCLLFAADRLEHSRTIEDGRRAGRHVVCDRYIYSSIAYQSLDPSITPERVIDVNRGCSIPDVTVYLRVPVSECLARLAHRRDAPTIYERKSKLEKIARNYAATRSLYETRFGPIIEIDGTAPAGVVNTEIVKHLAPFIA